MGFRVLFLLVGLWGGMVSAAPLTCAERVAGLAERAAEDIRTAVLGATGDQTMVAARAQRNGELAVREIIDAYDREAAEIGGLAEEAKACDGEKGCLMGVGRRVQARAALLKAVIWSAIGGERQARKELLEEAPELARKWIEENHAKLGLVDGRGEAGEVLTALVSEELGRKIQGDGFRPLQFLKSLGGHFLNAFRPSTYLALWRNRTAWNDYLKNVGTVLSIQFAAHVLQMVTDFVSGQPIKFSSMVWLYGNTVSMMTIQAAAGARNTTMPENPPSIESFNQAMERLPGILHGNEGYWKETKRKLLGFLALLPLEYSVSVLAKLTSVGIQTGSWNAVMAKTYETGIVNLVSTIIFGSYLSVRWALLDKWFNLNLLPAFRDGTRSVTEAKLAEMKRQGLIPNEWTAEDFYRLAVPWYLRGFGFWRRASEVARAQASAQPEVFRRIFESEEGLDFVAAYRQSNNARRLEWAWRYGMCLVDSFVVFGLFGKWIPWLLGFPG